MGHIDINQDRWYTLLYHTWHFPLFIFLPLSLSLSGSLSLSLSLSLYLSYIYLFLSFLSLSESRWCHIQPGVNVSEWVRLRGKWWLMYIFIRNKKNLHENEKEDAQWIGGLHYLRCIILFVWKFVYINNAYMENEREPKIESVVGRT